ncbi:MAG: DMT family transporter [Odoribacter sp.]|nr:DMT family transporter [Odoribacter sp.]
MSSRIKGYLIGAVAAATYGLNPLFALPCYGQGMNAESVLFWRYLLAIAVIGFMVMWRCHDFRLDRRQVLPVMCMGVLMAMSSLTLFRSYNYMSSGIASTLLFVYPVMVALIMTFIYRERQSPVTWGAVLLALGGIGMLYRGSDAGGSLSITGTVLVMVSSLTYAIYIVAVNRPPLNTLPSLKLTFWALVAGTVVLMSRFSTEPFSVPTGVSWLNISGLAILPTALSFLCTTRAIQLIGSTPTAILGALEPVTAAVIGVMVFGEHLTGRDITGMLVILIAVTMVVAGGSISEAIIRLRRMFPRGIQVPYFLRIFKK